MPSTPRQKKKETNDPRPDKSITKIIVCPMLSFESEVVTLKSCKSCEYHVQVNPADESSSEGHVICVFPRILPIRGMRGD